MKILRFSRIFVCLFLLTISGFAQRLNHDPTFNPVFNSNIKSLKIQSDGKIVVSGSFTAINGIVRKKMARLNADGTLDWTFDINYMSTDEMYHPTTIYSFTLLPDGKFLVTGRFAVYGENGQRFRRLNSDGFPDPTFTTYPRFENDGVDGEVKKVNQLANGKIMVCGSFLLPNGNQKPYLARYNYDGSFDTTFTTSINNSCNDLEVLPDGRFYVSGRFTTVNGVSSPGLVRFNMDGTPDPTFNANLAPDPAFGGIELLSGGRLMTSYGSLSSSNSGTVILNADGTRNFTYERSTVNDLAFQSNGKLFFLYGSDRLRRHNVDGSLDQSLNQVEFDGRGWGTDDDGNMKSGAMTSDQKLLIGGAFTEVEMNNNGTAIHQAYLVRFTQEAVPIKRRFDFDGDGKDDIAVYRPETGVWYVNKSTGGFFATQFGISSDRPVAGDYDNDGKADIAVYRDGAWYYLKSSDSTFYYRICGAAGDIPVYHYNYLRSPDVMVYRPSNANFYIQYPFGNLHLADMRNLRPLPGDIPVVADYEGDGIDDLAVFRNGDWFVKKSTDVLNVAHYGFGQAGDKPVQADYDGDGRADYAVFRPSNGTWYIQKSTEGFVAVQWGLADDLPVPADYDGDGKTDIAVYRGGVWYKLLSGGSYQIEQFGLPNDIPAQLK